jgi:hypothetical protein
MVDTALVPLLSYPIYGQDLIGRRGMGASNLDHSSRIRRLGHIFLLRFTSTRTERQEGTRVGGRESSSSGYRALNVTRFLPTRSRSREDLVLQTYSEENSPLEAGDNGATRLVSNDGGGGVQQHSSSNVGSNSGGMGRGSSSKR